MKNMIFALVGPSGSGKSTLIIEAANKLQGKLEIIKSVTTRAKREEKDNLFYFFISEERFRLKVNDDDFAEIVSYAGNLYGYDRRAVDTVLAKRHGICAATEHGVIALMRSGYHVKAIGIAPIYKKSPISDAREKADRERRKIHITFQKEIINSFLKGGKEKAIKELVDYIKIFTKGGYK